MVKKFFRNVFCLLLLLGGSAWAQPFPQPIGYVADTARLISAADKERIELWAKQLQEKTTAQITVVTVPSIGDLTIEEYAVKLFEHWGIGQKQKDNGVLLLVAAKERRLRIEVGYGLEGALTDVRSSSIISSIIVPAFKAGRFSEGITKGAWAIVSVVASEYNVEISGQPAYAGASDSGQSDIAWVVILIVFIFVFFLWTGFGGWGGHSGRYQWGAPNRYRGWGGGGFSGGGGGFSGGGGFGGFGGGMSGGGGASGRW